MSVRWKISAAAGLVVATLTLPGCNIGNVLQEIFKERPPAPLERAEISSDARLDSAGTIAGSFVGEGTSRQVHLISSDTGLIAALTRRYTPASQARGGIWAWLSRQGSYAINVDPVKDATLARQAIVAGSPDGHTAVELRTLLLSGSPCGWRGAQAQLIVVPSRSGGPVLRGPVVGSIRSARELGQSDVSYRTAPPPPSPRLTDTLLAVTEAVMDSVLGARLSSRDAPLAAIPGSRVEVNTLEDVDAADVLPFQLDDGRIRYAVSLRERRRSVSGYDLVAATVMVWDSTLVWRQTVFNPTLLELRYNRLQPWRGWPAVFWRRLDALSGFAFQRDYLWMEQVDVSDNSVLWTVLEPRSNTVVAAAEVAGPC
jgi:hypothetical protein